jgi:hypothetical protein
LGGNFDILREGRRIFLGLKEFLVYEGSGETGETSIAT